MDNYEYFSKIVLSSVLIVGMTGCVSTRGLVSLESPVKQINTQESGLKTAVIKIVEDNVYLKKSANRPIFLRLKVDYSKRQPQIKRKQSPVNVTVMVKPWGTFS